MFNEGTAPLAHVPALDFLPLFLLLFFLLLFFLLLFFLLLFSSPFSCLLPIKFLFPVLFFLLTERSEVIP